jgi:hypothetical protein
MAEFDGSEHDLLAGLLQSLKSFVSAQNHVLKRKATNSI